MRGDESSHSSNRYGTSVNTNNPTHPRHPEPGWQILGELELSVSEPTEVALRTWLTELCGSFGLPAELLNKITLSAHDAATRAIRTDAALKFEHIHLIVFVPSNRTQAEQTWNFFRVEKIEENSTTNQAGADHAIEFYLYGEGN